MAFLNVKLFISSFRIYTVEQCVRQIPSKVYLAIAYQPLPYP